MSCALASPADGVCANKRPVQGRRARQAVAPVALQATLTPLAEGHARVPFPTDAPESNFTMSQLQAPEPALTAPRIVEAPAVHPIRTNLPSFREIKAGRAAAASRTPVAEVRIPLEELEGGTLLTDAAARVEGGASPVAPVLPGMDQLVERVRQRTAARMSRAGMLSPA